MMDNDEVYIGSAALNDVVECKKIRQVGKGGGMTHTYIQPVHT